LVSLSNCFLILTSHEAISARGVVPTHHVGLTLCFKFEKSAPPPRLLIKPWLAGVWPHCAFSLPHWKQKRYPQRHFIFRQPLALTTPFPQRRHFLIVDRFRYSSVRRSFSSFTFCSTVALYWSHVSPVW